MTKRVYEVAKEYGVSAKNVIKVLGDHNIKAGNFTGIDDSMRAILDKSFKETKKAEKPAEQKKGMEGTGRKVNDNNRAKQAKPQEGQKQGNSHKQNRPEQGNNAKKQAQPARNGNKNQQSGSSGQNHQNNRGQDNKKNAGQQNAKSSGNQNNRQNGNQQNKQNQQNN